MIKLLRSVLFFLSGLWPRNPRKLIFGAWLGSKFADNPKYLLLYLAREFPDLDLIWIGNASTQDSLPKCPSVRFVPYGSLSALYQTLSAGFCFITHGTQDVSKVNLLRRSKVVYLGHGLALKHMGTRYQPLPNAFLEFVRHLIRKAECYSHFISSSERHATKLFVEYQINGATAENVMKTGQPRIDFLLENRDSVAVSEVRKKLVSEHAIPDAKRIITYLPTFRDKHQRTFSFHALNKDDYAGVQNLLESFDAVLIEKSHFADGLREGAAAAIASGRICCMRGGVTVDTQELLLATDLLITDYSGCFLDFLVLDRPILHFAYDREYYTASDRGLYFDLENVAGGPVVEVFGSLCDNIEQELRNPQRNSQRRHQVRASMITFETGAACQKISHAILGLVANRPLSVDSEPCSAGSIP